MHDTIFLAAVILLGACLGSFLNVVIYRVPRRTFFSKGSRSKCPHCDTGIAWFDNVPVLSWLLLRGRARCCGNPISPRYPLVEALTAALIGLLWTQVMAGGVAGANLQEWLWFLFRTGFLAVLVACTFIDIDHRILPDVLTKPTMVLGCVGALVAPGLAGQFAGAKMDPRVNSLLFSLAGLLCGYLVTAALRQGASKLFGKEAMGFGDVKFMGAIGAFVGWDGALMTLLLGALLGSVYGLFHRWVTGEAEVFFGPFLAAGPAITLFLKPWLVIFFTETWPKWQAEMPPWVTFVATALCIVLLVVLIKRGRAR